MESKFVYALTVTEHERGWGTRPDGYMCFPDEESADKWVKETYAKRSGAVPHEYDTYDGGRYTPVHESLYEKVKQDGHVWVRSLDEVIKPTKTRKIDLVWTLELEEEDQKLTDDEIYNKYFGDTVVIGQVYIL